MVTLRISVSSGNLQRRPQSHVIVSLRRAIVLARVQHVEMVPEPELPRPRYRRAFIESDVQEDGYTPPMDDGDCRPMLLRMGTYNIVSARNNRLEEALRSIKSLVNLILGY
jgi:hypothetical protein